MSATITKTVLLCLAVLATPSYAEADQNSLEYQMNANPIRKVVTLLQKMENTVRAEGEKEKELFDKYMCYCKNGAGSLQKSISDADTKIPQVQSSIESAESMKSNLEADVKQHQTDRDAAKAAMAEATSLREKEAAAFAAEKAEDDTNLAALKKAKAAIEAGGGASFLQSAAAGTLRKFMYGTKIDMSDFNRETLTAFLAEDSSDADSEGSPGSGQIIGIMKQMEDTMVSDMKEKADAEATAIKNYDELMSAKTKEVQAATDAIESKTKRIGELGVEIVMMKEDLSDTEEALIEDTKFLQDLEKNCKTVGAEYEARQKTRGEELLAIADTIKILNDDDALELFKKTLPGSSLLQVKVRSAEMRNKALALLRDVRKPGPKSAGLDFIALALTGKKVSFDKVIKMIDELVKVLKQEQLDDNHKKEYCEMQFDVTEDKKKELVHDIGDLESEIEEMKSSIATLTDEIAALEEGIKELDKSVAEATEQRKEEHSDYEALMAADTAAQDIMGFAKNRLNKFYNPTLYKAPPKRELTEEERITLNMGGTLAPTAAPGGIAGTGVTVFVQIKTHTHKDAPGAPPAIGTYSSKGEESNGVIAMIDGLIADLEKEMTEATTTEKNAQEDYETMMTDSADKRTEDSKSIADKTEMKAGLEGDLSDATGNLASKNKELMATEGYMASLHAECDWLIENFDLRKTARSGEIDAMTKAKAVLSGADYSLAQTSRKVTFLRKKNNAMGACMDMCAEIHPDKTLQECQKACGGEVTWGDADTSQLCMKMCTEAIGYKPEDCQHKC